MMAAAMQLVFFLSVLVIISGAADIFKLVNTSVQLDVQRKSEDFDLFWRFNNKINIVKHTTTKTTVYKSNDKVEFNERTYSLTLKNIQKNDSGLYEAVEFDAIIEIVAAYQLQVLDPVENPVFSVSRQQNNDTCNVTFICEAQKLSITSHCYNGTCNKEEKKIPGENHSLLSMYFTNRLIICNYSNPVSWKNRSMEMEEIMKKYCPSKETDPPGSGIPNGLDSKTVIITTTIIIFIVVGVVVAVICWCKKPRQNKGTDNTVYEEVQGGNKAQSAEMTVSPETPGTVYCTVGMAAQACSNDENTVITANSGNQLMEMNPKQSNIYDTPDTLPQTIYATVNKAGKGA